MTNKITYTMGEKIKRARTAAGLSQKDLAGRLQLSDKAVSSYEVGRAQPSIEVLKEISSLTEQPLVYFLDEQPHVDLELQAKLKKIERELAEIKTLLQEREEY